VRQITKGDAYEKNGQRAEQGDS